MRLPAPGWLRLRTPKPEIRTVEVHPPSQGDEGAFAFLTAVFVVLCVIYVVAFERYGLGQARRIADRVTALDGRSFRTGAPSQILHDVAELVPAGDAVPGVR